MKSAKRSFLSLIIILIFCTGCSPFSLILIRKKVNSLLFDEQMALLKEKVKFTKAKKYNALDTRSKIVILVEMDYLGSSISYVLIATKKYNLAIKNFNYSCYIKTLFDKLDQKDLDQKLYNMIKKKFNLQCSHSKTMIKGFKILQEGRKRLDEYRKKWREQNKQLKKIGKDFKSLKNDLKEIKKQVKQFEKNNK